MNSPITPWTAIGRAGLNDLAEARAQAHWAIQLLSSAADAALAPRPDDSHTNVFWDTAHEMLVGRDLGGIRLGLSLSTWALVALADQEQPIVSLEGRTLDQARRSLEDRLGVLLARSLQLALRDYEMPAHPVADTGRFMMPQPSVRDELAGWFANGTLALEAFAQQEPRATPVAIWPHHFDIGGIVFLDPTAPAERVPQVGFGMSPGDDHIAQPYFYVTPWPISDSASMTGLPGGRWTREPFTGAVLEADEIARQARGDDQARLVADFLASAAADGASLVLRGAG